MAVMAVPIVLLLFSVAMTIVLCVVCMNLAKQKGYDPVLGFLLGFFGHIFGLVVLLVLPRNEAKLNHSYHRNQYAHRQNAYHRSPAGHGAATGRTRSGYKPVGKPKSDPFNQPPPPMQAIPKTPADAQVACPHCNTVLTVSQPGEYTCPNCQQLFIY